MNHQKDTIAAISTPVGLGAVGIVRLSGPDALAITGKIFTPGRKKKSLEPYRLVHGWIASISGEALDEVLVSFMPGPGSYTGEDTIEINCHGNPAILEGVLEAVLALGARMAEPGEFTKRAFLNGKMDLTRAEAVIELINAPTQAGVFMARNKLQGLLAEKIQGLRQSLEELKKQLCLAVDFPEEEIECLSQKDLAGQALACCTDLRGLITDSDQNRIWTDGALVVLTGRVNAGKSSLMNAILGRERAIVTELPGTTRDYLEEGLNLKGLPVRLVDTAGLRATADQVEKKGMERGWELIRSAHVLVLVMDATLAPSPQDQEVLAQTDPEKLIIALNKWDLAASPLPWIKTIEHDYPDVLKISAKTGLGLEQLLSRIRQKALAGQELDPGGCLLPNLRQKSCLEKAVLELEALAGEALAGIPYDLLAARLDYACAELDQITGRITPDEVLDSIFDNFCIGK
ncbi:tRNA uridine-5-carboxymethylaminomethyl(34) synthesis GTPase MnmE [Desulfonatronovibrio hydrogenovorans]|uniref:tRNA uridine-5-carboxymethylaminomethyl(34) synthesis GTPase MnmE n=1 Tax=Desulfonatronovibrio hydrogenovorans TaxID=53245 RepID=UPI0004912F47|nr:tRNA uridine-5-carboxymethylaminomethyl(34) synthesis GTPase MnmE [Desulfonatronovibrio hydrogenovorans]